MSGLDVGIGAGAGGFSGGNAAVLRVGTLTEVREPKPGRNTEQEASKHADGKPHPARVAKRPHLMHAN